MNKPALEYFDIRSIPWEPVASGLAGLSMRTLAADPESGIATRILRFAPGTDTSPNGVLVHDYWEEAYILDGWLEEIDTGRRLTAGMYACRPPGMPHGRWRAPEGCTVFEVRYPPPSQS